MFALEETGKSFLSSMAAAAGGAMPRTRRRLFACGRIDAPRIIAFRLPAAIGAHHLIGMRTDEFFKFLSAFFAFVL